MQDDVNDGDMDYLSSEDEDLLDPLKSQFGKLKDRGFSINVSNSALKQQQKHLQQLNEQRQVIPQEQQQLQQIYKATSQQQQRQQRQQQVQSVKTKNASKDSKSIAGKRNSNECLGDSDSLSGSTKIARPPSRTNQFELLSEIDIKSIDRHVDVSISATKKSSATATNSANTGTIKSSNLTSNQSANGAATQANSVDASTSRFCPPIILYNVDIRGLVLQFKKNYPNVEIKIVNCSKNKSKLNIKGIEAYSVMMRVLKEKKISSHSFTPPENKQVSLIVRGLHRLSVTDDIKNELDSLIPGVVSGVQVFMTPYMKKNKLISDLFTVTLLPGKTYKDVTSVKYLLYQKIYWKNPIYHQKKFSANVVNVGDLLQKIVTTRFSV